MAKQIINILKLPIWLVSLATGEKSFVDNPVIGSPLLNKMGLHKFRVQLAAKMAVWRRLWLARFVNAEDITAYQQDGFVLKPDFIPQDKFADLEREVMDSDWPLREMRQGSSVTRRVPLDPARLHKTHPALAELISDPDLIALIHYVASTGGQPIFYIQAILSEGDADNNDPQSSLHVDTFHSNAKAWLFLCDVKAECGPLAYVPGSHKLTPARLDWIYQQSIHTASHPVRYYSRGSFRYTDDDLQQLSLPSARKMTVPANTLVVADTIGIHTRTPSEQANCRIEIYATLRHNSFLPWTGLDFLSLPYIRGNVGSFSMAAMKILQKFGLAKMPWQSVGTGKINEPARI
jgi:hypothetical protein